MMKEARHVPLSEKLVRSVLSRLWLRRLLWALPLVGRLFRGCYPPDDFFIRWLSGKGYNEPRKHRGFHWVFK